MSLPVRSCLCRRHSERFGGPLGPRQWLRLLRRSTCSKRGSVRTVFFFSSIGSFFFFWWWSFIITVGCIQRRRHQIKRRHALKRVLGASRYMYDSENRIRSSVDIEKFFLFARFITLSLLCVFFFFFWFWFTVF